VVVDLGLPLDDTAYAFLDSADRIVMTVLPEMVGLRNTRLMIDQLQARGHGEEKVWLVLNRATIPSGIARQDIEGRLRVRVHSAVPDDQALVSLSVNRGVPLVLTDERSAVAKAIRRVAYDLVQERSGGRRSVSAPAAAPAAPAPTLTPALVPARAPRPSAQSAPKPLLRWLRRPGSIRP
jgi:pilus assembly protein CpaE